MENRPITTSLDLTDREILFLDTFDVSDKTRAAIDAAKIRQSLIVAGLNERDARLIQKIVSTAREHKKLTYVHDSIRMCFTCGKDAGYAPYKTTCRSGRKGEPNRDKPRYLSAVEFNRGFISMKGILSAGACTNCVDRLRSQILAALEGIECEIPKALSGIDPDKKRVDIRHCKKCDWRGSETEMRKMPALMGGYYPAGCPNCDAVNRPLSEDRPIETVSGEYAMVPAR